MMGYTTAHIQEQIDRKTKEGKWMIKAWRRGEREFG